MSAAFYARRFPGSLIFFAPGVLFAGLYAQSKVSGLNYARLALAGLSRPCSIARSIVAAGVWLVTTPKSKWFLALSSDHTFTASFTTFFLLFFSWNQSSLGARLLALSSAALCRHHLLRVVPLPSAMPDRFS